MDNSDSYQPDKSTDRLPLGMSSFGPKEREEFGRSIRLAMSCIETPPPPNKDPGIPQDEAAIRRRLKTLSQEITSNHADLLECLIRFDELEGWKSSGASHCAAWMNMEIGVGIQMGWEYLRVGRKLRLLPTLRALFSVGKISWSKVRLITRVADKENEKILCYAALDASVSDIKRLCEGYRWNDDDRDGENNQALQQWNSRSFTWDETSNGSTQIKLTLPPELAQAFLNSVEQSLNQLDIATETKMSARRADAALLMAETSLQSAGRDTATADRYQVHISIDESELSPPTANHHCDKHEHCNTAEHEAEHCDKHDHKHSQMPGKRPSIIGASPIATETARRIACDCSITINKTANGEPIDIGRKSRIWPTAMARAIKERDQQCVWPGCTQSRHLHIHHMKHWADGGSTSVENGACLCSHHHTLVHEGGYTIQRVENNPQLLQEQFIQQLNTHDKNQFEFEQSLRHDRESFDKVRKLTPENFRFRVIDSKGRDIREKFGDDDDSIDQNINQYKNKSIPPKRSSDYTHVYCSEPLPDIYHGNFGQDNRDELIAAVTQTYEMQASYAVRT